MAIYLRVGGLDGFALPIPDNAVISRLNELSKKVVTPPYFEMHAFPDISPFHITSTFRILGEEKDNKIMTVDYSLWPDVNTGDLPVDMVSAGRLMLSEENIARLLGGAKEAFTITTYDRLISANCNYLVFYVCDNLTFAWGKPAVAEVYAGPVIDSVGEISRVRRVMNYNYTLDKVVPDYSGKLGKSAQIAETAPDLDMNTRIENPAKFFSIEIGRRDSIEEIIQRIILPAAKHLQEQ